jgi:hypothetical protein
MMLLVLDGASHFCFDDAVGFGAYFCFKNKDDDFAVGFNSCNAASSFCLIYVETK